MAISMLKIRRPLGRLIFYMGIAIPGKTVFLIEMAPRSFEIISNLFLGSLDMYINIDIFIHISTLNAQALHIPVVLNVQIFLLDGTGDSGQEA